MRVRTFHVNFFLDKNELSHLEKICKESGLGKSKVIRNLIMGVEIKPRPTEEQLRLVREYPGSQTTSTRSRALPTRSKAFPAQVEELQRLCSEALSLVRESL